MQELERYQLIKYGLDISRQNPVTEGLIDDVQGDFRAGIRRIDKIFTLKQIGKKTQEKMQGLFWFYGFEKMYERVNREALWQVLKMYDVDGKLLMKLKVCMLIVYPVSK